MGFYLKHRMKNIFDVNSAGGQTLSNQSAGGFKALYHHWDLPSHVLYADFPCIGLLKKRFMYDACTRPNVFNSGVNPVIPSGLMNCEI